MEWKACREQHPGGMGDGVPHINNMSDQRFPFKQSPKGTNSAGVINLIRAERDDLQRGLEG